MSYLSIDVSSAHTKSPNFLVLIIAHCARSLEQLASCAAFQTCLLSLFRFLTVHGSADMTIPVEDAYEFAKLIPNHKLHVIEGANHNYTAHRKEVADAVVDFIMSNGV